MKFSTLFYKIKRKKLQVKINGKIYSLQGKNKLKVSSFSLKREIQKATIPIYKHNT